MTRYQQIWFVGVITCSFIVVIGMNRDIAHTGLSSEEFIARKMSPTHSNDLVAAGDSRTTSDIAPMSIRVVFPRLRVMNYGFDAMGYSVSYLDFIRSHLDDNGAKIVLLGITPRSLRAQSIRRNQFTESPAESSVERTMNSRLADFLTYFKPISLVGIFHQFLGNNIYDEQIYYFDGWVSRKKVPANPAELVANYEDIFREDKVSNDVIAGLLSKVRQWSREGISVYGIRLPGSPAINKVEDSLAGFDEDRFVADFVRAGGRWLKLDSTKYKTVDGCHLDGESAKLFSTQLATLIYEDKK